MNVMEKKRILVCGAGGFIGGHLVRRLLGEGHTVFGIDLKDHEHIDLRSLGCDFMKGDLRDAETCKDVLLLAAPTHIYQFAAEMGGAGFIFTRENDADIMSSSALININMLDALSRQKVKPRIFYSSSACIYPEHNQLDPSNPVCAEDTAYPACPDSEYGWEKLFSERLYLSHARNKDIDVRIARFHNVFGPEGTWDGGREKAPAAICRKIARAQDGDDIFVWGDGEQTRSFLYIDECLEGIERLMESSFVGPVNIGSSELVSINDLARTIIGISGKNIGLEHIDGPLGVRGRCSDNRLIEEKLGWKPTMKLVDGLRATYAWIDSEVRKAD